MGIDSGGVGSENANGAEVVGRSYCDRGKSRRNLKLTDIEYDFKDEGERTFRLGSRLDSLLLWLIVI